MNKNDFLFCYDKRLADFIRLHNIEPITIAKNPKTEATFSMFVQSECLSKIIQQFKAHKQGC
ncbi:hypothetical protein [Evansella cellulosilytica]|uniref:DUF5659 domain-containing protein n=1 Tax=Evansella cellulosilytica (strain ATCC 21833 / DSM 2522 / FERM P-1141 / JCM 9156 / N-4) TaxID=649639 RepID=E6U1H6_EVAC2|nr:hypothetical protein [Evansella cellulosilytica]ADU30339.1 hypothetical protein Bcell_2078 [Evansella cellulosilytica DSM 2522]